MSRDLLLKAQTDISAWMCGSGDVTCTVCVTRAMTVNDDTWQKGCMKTKW